MEKIGIFLITILVLLGLTGIVGWGKSVVNFIHCDFKAPYKCEIVNGVGTFTPVGMIIGWVNITD